MDPHQLPDRQGATTFLFLHVWDRQLIRQISVTKDFNPGAPPVNYFVLTDEIRSAVGYHVQQLNRNSPDPRHAIWACQNIYILRGELCFVAECLTSNPRPKSHQDPTIFMHLAMNGTDQFELKSQLVVSNSFQPPEAPYPYFNVTKPLRKAIKDQLYRLNNEGDIRNHPWALHAIHAIAQGKPAEVVGVVLVVHWQACEPEGPYETDHLRPPVSPVPSIRIRASPPRWVCIAPPTYDTIANYEPTLRDNEREGNLPPYVA